MPDKPAPLDPGSRPEHLFIVRMWQEPSRRTSDRWRGSAEHVPSGRRVYFVSLSDLSAFITLYVSSQPGASDAIDSN